MNVGIDVTGQVVLQEGSGVGMHHDEVSLRVADQICMTILERILGRFDVRVLTATIEKFTPRISEAVSANHVTEARDFSNLLEPGRQRAQR